MTKIHGMISYFNEEPALLYESVSRVCALGVDHVLAMDGPYELYPYDWVDSGQECEAAIVEACRAHDATCWVVRPHMSWKNNEVGKRNAMLHLVMAPVAVAGSSVTERPSFSMVEHGVDWLLTFDADHMWSEVDPVVCDLGHILGLTLRDVAEVSFGEDRDHQYEARLLNRAVAGMHYEGAHWRIRYPDGRSSSTLRAGDEVDQVEVLDLKDSFSVWHAIYDQPDDRLLRQQSYYELRDRGKHER